MNPKPIVQLQAVAVLLVVTAALLVLGHRVALALGVLLLVSLGLWLAFALRYRRLQRQTRAVLSRFRRDNDDVMLGCLGLGLLLPLAVTWTFRAIALDVAEPPLVGAEATLLALAAATVPLAMLVSSSVDWYLIRPFRDGVVGEPACRSSLDDENRAAFYTRMWVGHRMVSEFFVFIAIFGAIVVLSVALADSTESESGKTLLGLLGLSGILAWSYRELAKLVHALDFVRYPSASGLGTWTSGTTAGGEHIQGFVLDASVAPGVQLIDEPRGPLARDISNEDHCVPLSFRKSLKPIEPLTSTCEGQCQFWFATCEHGLRQRDQGPDR